MQIYLKIQCKGAVMTIAIPLNNMQMFYQFNPHTAPKFAIYFIDGDKTNITFSLRTIVDNPWSNLRLDSFEEEQIKCRCDIERRNSMRHKCDHYALLDLIGGCSYLLANQYCENTAKSMKNGGITIFKIPPIINKSEIAIKNFLIGESLANKVQYIHNAS